MAELLNEEPSLDFLFDDDFFNDKWPTDLLDEPEEVEADLQTLASKKWTSCYMKNTLMKKKKLVCFDI